MATLSEIETWLQDQLATLLAEHEVPGAAVGVLLDGGLSDREQRIRELLVDHTDSANTARVLDRLAAWEEVSP